MVIGADPFDVAPLSAAVPAPVGHVPSGATTAVALRQLPAPPRRVRLVLLMILLVVTAAAALAWRLGLVPLPISP